MYGEAVKGIGIMYPFRYNRGEKILTKKNVIILCALIILLVSGLLLYDLLKTVSVKSIKKEETSGWLYTVYFEKEKNTASIEMISSTIWEISGQWYEVSASDGEKVLKTVTKVANK